MHFSSYRKSFLALTGVCLAFYACGGSGGGTAGTGGIGASGGNGGSSASSGSGGGAADGGGGTGGFNVGDGGGTGGSGGVIDPDAGCAHTDITSSLVPANILFVVDKSGSMNCNLPADGQTTADCDKNPAKKDPTKPSKWDLTKPALQQAITTLSQSGLAQSGKLSVGVSMFPKDGSACTAPDPNNPNVTVKPLDSAWATSIDAYLDTVTPLGQTPLVGATINGYAYMHSSTFTGNKFVVVLTDGFETCAPSLVPGFLDTTNCSSPSSCPAEHANQVGIRTFVIGVPGSEDGRAVLSELAFVGGTARDPNCTHVANPPQSPNAGSDAGDCHYDMTDPNVDFAAALSDALQKISGTVLSCEVDTPKNPNGGSVDYSKVNVKVGSNYPAQDASGNSDACDPSWNGWHYNADKSKIILCGTACDEAKQPNASIQVVLGCPTGIF